ncbi:hypothetical protein GPECTOR_76g811 [Gonium pectorale]|uniref:Ricin B lectin domain-containing protein n=1 Tax=Gonium pectorale TaxID=33097 RepID=A0A150G2C8_GONPE|nr:hypothetical protein GPECTOR_76g811 [Gonium pectorale]|eukprot:KXZ43988.1 hypothetical protein GPECTOR_76g811 [Gonium pectorale]
MRIEKKQDGGDDTAANSIVFSCSNNRGSEVNAHSGFWGDWNQWTWCPGETYICGLQVRVESPGGDDTATGAYVIKVTYSGLCLTVQNGGSSWGNRITLDTCANGARHQTWSIVPIGASLYTLSPTHASGMCLDISGANSADGATVQLWGCNQTPAQIFSLNLPTRATTGRIEGLAGIFYRCLDVSGNNQNPGTFMHSFTITAQGTNAYQIKSAGGFCVAAQNYGTSSGTRVIIDRCTNGAMNQLWKTSAGYQGGIRLSPYHAPNLCMDVSYADMLNGAVVWLWNCHGGIAQSWKLMLPVS